MRYGELFAGAGGLSLGLDRAGMECAFHAEIEDFPRRVLKHHWPDTPLYGDVSELDGKKLIRECGQIDLLSGGSPCQDLSVAGKRKGMSEGSGTRSSLYYEQIRIWKETGADLILWENVDGARSSNKGKDFALVLQAIVGGTVPVPERKGKRISWPRSGVVSGPTGVAAWRMLDAQWFGVPQRRRRVFVLGTRTLKYDPAQILLEPEGLPRNPPSRREAGKGATESFGGSTEETGGGVGTLNASGAGLNRPAGQCNELDFVITQGAIPILEATSRQGLSNEGSAGIGKDADPMFTLQATQQHGVLAFGTDGHGQAWTTPAHPSLCAQQVSDTSARQHGVLAFGWQNSQSQGDSVGEITPARDKSKTPAVLCAAWDRVNVTSKTNRSRVEYGLPSPTLHSEGMHVIECAEYQHEERTVGALLARGISPGHNADDFFTVAKERSGVPRRLMPVECERLMGWEDGWTDVPDERGKPASDSARYRACGNGVVSNCSEWIGHRIIQHLTPKQQETE